MRDDLPGGSASASRPGRGERSGLRCPHCGMYGSLRVKWTRVKGDSLRRDVFYCRACGEPATGWLSLDQPETPPPHLSRERAWEAERE